ncbi:MAG: S9 family peptidase [Acidobacteriota bacterium]
MTRRLGATAVFCLGLALVVAAGTPAAADLPPLIPRDVLFGNPVKDVPCISPHGSLLAYLAPSKEGVLNVWIKTIGRDDDRMVTEDRGSGVVICGWAFDSRHILFMQDTEGDEDYHLFSVDIESTNIRDLTPFKGVTAENLMMDLNHPNEVMIGMNLRDRALYDMYRVDLTSGAVTLEATNPGDVLGWTADAGFVIRAATAFRPSDLATVIRVRDTKDGPWRDLVVMPFEEAPFLGQVNGGNLVSGFAPDGKSLYLATFGRTDTMRLVSVDVATGEEIETLAYDGRGDLKQVWTSEGSLRYSVLIHPRTHKVQAATFEYLKPEVKVIDLDIGPDFQFLGNSHPGFFFLGSRDTSDRRWVVGYEVDNGPVSYYLYDRGRRSLELLFDDQPALKGYRMPHMEPLVIRARDGVELVSYLTLPLGVPAEGLPMVLDPHGGPWWRYSWGYDPRVQWLANRGYAVLQVNFRGSTGFGKTHFNAGTGQWGVGGMQNDLTDAVKWAIGKGIADPKRVAIMGASYGGYATLAGLAFTPDLYACGVESVGMSNVATDLESIPAYWGPVKKRWFRRIGFVEGDDELNDELNRRISPLFHVDRIRAPLLVAHGANDVRCKLSESEQIVKSMRERHLPVSLVVYPDEGHVFARPENKQDFYGRAEEFLAKYLGGRAEPWNEVKGTSAQLR